VGEEAVLPGGCFRGEDWGVGKYGLFQDFFAGGAVKACPGVAPGVGGVGAVVDGVHGADEKGVACFQMVGVAAALVDAIGCNPEHISVAVEDFTPVEWQDEFRKEVTESEHIYKEPHYDPKDVL